MSVRRKAWATQVADRVSVAYDSDNESYRFLLYRNGYERPFAECNLTSEMMIDMIDADTERRIDEDMRLAS